MTAYLYQCQSIKFVKYEVVSTSPLYKQICIKDFDDVCAVPVMRGSGFRQQILRFERNIYPRTIYSIILVLWCTHKSLNAGGCGRSKNVIACHLFTYIFNKFVRVFLTSLIFIEVCYCLAATQSILNNINITFYIKYKLESYTQYNIYQPRAQQHIQILSVDEVKYSGSSNTTPVTSSYIQNMSIILIIIMPLGYYYAVMVEGWVRA